jgi:hypothetical protein
VKLLKILAKIICNVRHPRKAASLLYLSCEQNILPVLPQKIWTLWLP